jgi:hypothetical protein
LPLDVGARWQFKNLNFYLIFHYWARNAFKLL